MALAVAKQGRLITLKPQAAPAAALLASKPAVPVPVSHGHTHQLRVTKILKCTHTAGGDATNSATVRKSGEKVGATGSRCANFKFEAVLRRRV